MANLLGYLYQRDLYSPAAEVSHEHGLELLSQHGGILSPDLSKPVRRSRTVKTPAAPSLVATVVNSDSVLNVAGPVSSADVASLDRSQQSNTLLVPEGSGTPLRPLDIRSWAAREARKGLRKLVRKVVAR